MSVYICLLLTRLIIFIVSFSVIFLNGGCPPSGGPTHICPLTTPLRPKPVMCLLGWKGKNPNKATKSRTQKSWFLCSWLCFPRGPALYLSSNFRPVMRPGAEIALPQLTPSSSGKEIIRTSHTGRTSQAQERRRQEEQGKKAHLK